MNDTSPKEKNNAIVWVLLVVAVLAAAFGGWSFLRCSRFSRESYDAQIDDINRKIAELQEKRPDLQSAFDAAVAAVYEDPSTAGEEAAVAQKRVEELTLSLEEKTQQLSSLQDELARSKDWQGACSTLRTEYGQAIRQLEDMIIAGQSDKKIFYWTFDDGPSIWTHIVLEAAEQHGAYVTFFTSREANSNSKNEEEDARLERELLRQEMMGGHSVQNHTYSHQYAEFGNVYGQGLDSFKEVVKAQDEWVYECTGFHTSIFRFPGGNAWAKGLADTRSGGFDGFLDYLKTSGYQWIQWNMDAYDNGIANPDTAAEKFNVGWESDSLGRDSLAQTGTEYHFAVLLSHDWNVNTTYAFSEMVPTLQEKGWIFLPLLPESITMGDYTQIIYR